MSNKFGIYIVCVVYDGSEIVSLHSLVVTFDHKGVRIQALGGAPTIDLEDKSPVCTMLVGN